MKWTTIYKTQEQKNQLLQLRIRWRIFSVTFSFKLDDEGGIASTTPVPTFNYSQSSLSHDFWAYNRSDINYIQSKVGRDDKNTLASRIRENKNENIDT